MKSIDKRAGKKESRKMHVEKSSILIFFSRDEEEIKSGSVEWRVQKKKKSKRKNKHRVKSGAHFKREKSNWDSCWLLVRPVYQPHTQFNQNKLEKILICLYCDASAHTRQEVIALCQFHLIRWCCFSIVRYFSHRHNGITVEYFVFAPKMSSVYKIENGRRSVVD